MAILLDIRDISGGYYKEDIVRGVSLTVSPGDFLGIIGPNGCGKTTFFRLVTRVLPLRRGEVYFRESDIAKMPLKEFCRQVAFVSGELVTDFSFTVMEIVLMGRIPHLKRMQFESAKDIMVAKEALSMTDSLDLRDKRIDELSAGERQRVLIAKALATQPVLLFLDEPTAHLDIGHQTQILDLLKRLNRQKNLTIVTILHDLNLASAYTNRIALFNHGAIYKEGSPEDVLTYQNIEAVYKTVVLVNDNPVTHKPNILLVPAS
jgi:iron complex transport system ATP-binding protein